MLLRSRFGALFVDLIVGTTPRVLLIPVALHHELARCGDEHGESVGDGPGQTQELASGDELRGTHASVLGESGERLQDDVPGLLMPLAPAPCRCSERPRDLPRDILGGTLALRPWRWPPRRRGNGRRRAEHHPARAAVSKPAFTTVQKTQVPQNFLGTPPPKGSEAQTEGARARRLEYRPQ